MIHLNKATWALTSVSVLALSTAAIAADAPKAKTVSTVDELVVTAQKREERVQDVPISINVVGAEQLDRQQVNSLFDLSRISPALELTNAAGQAPGGGGAIRGLGTQTFGIGAVGSVGVVVDGVSQGTANISELFDIERVEVLKGPQGTLFGLTTSAGVINIITRAPSFTEFSGHVRTELSGEGTAGSTGYGNQVTQASINIPMGDKAGMRLSANVNLRQGPGRNALDGSLDEHNSYSYRGRLLLKPTDKITVNVNADWSKSKGDGPDFFTMFKGDPTLTAQLADCRLNAASPATPIIANDSNRDYCTTRISHDGSRNYGGSISGDYALDNLTLTSITAVRRTRSLPYVGLDIFRLDNALFFQPNIPGLPGFSPTRPIPINPNPTSISSAGGPNPGPSTLFTQEFRIASASGAKLEYTAGLFYANQSTRSFGGSAGAVVVDTFTRGGFVLPLGAPATSLPSSSQDWSKAVFGQATYHLTDQLSLTGGLRFTSEALKQQTINAAGIITRSRAEVDNTSWRIGAQYQVDPSLMTYASVSRGYKGPQFAGVPTGSPPGTPSRSVLPEIPTDYEIGAKKTLFDGRAILDLSAFYIEMENFQGQSCSTNPTTQILSCLIENFGGVISKGLEANLFGRVSDDITVSTGLIWNQATYPEHAKTGGPFVTSDGSNISGAQLLNAPEWKFTFSGEYSHEVFSGLEGFVSADAVYKSDIRYAASVDPLLSYPGNWVVGGRLGVRSMDGKWAASAFVRNATDEHTPVLRQAGFPYGANYGQFLSTGSFRVVGIILEAGF